MTVSATTGVELEASSLKKLEDRLRRQLFMHDLSFRMQGVPQGTLVKPVFTIEGGFLVVRMEYLDGSPVQGVEVFMYYRSRGNPARDWIN